VSKGNHYSIVLDDGETWSSEGWIAVYRGPENPNDEDFDGANRVPEERVKTRIPIADLIACWWENNSDEEAPEEEVLCV